MKTTTAITLAIIYLAPFAYTKEEFITTASIGAKNPDVYDFYADTQPLQKYFTDSTLIPRLSVTPEKAVLRTKAEIEKIYGTSLQNIMINIGSTSVRSQPGKQIWYYHLFPQWIDSEGKVKQLPVLVLPNGDVLLPKKK